MSRATDIFENDVEAAENDLPAKFIFGGKHYTGSVTESDAMLAMQENGQSQELDFQLVVRLGAFGSNPPMAEESWFKMIEPYESRMRVKKVAFSQEGRIYTYTCCQNNEEEIQPEK